MKRIKTNGLHTYFYSHKHGVSIRVSHQVHTLTYNLFNCFRQLELSANTRKQHIDTVRIKLYLTWIWLHGL